MNNTHYYMIFGGWTALAFIYLGFWIWKKIEEYKFRKELKKYQERQNNHHRIKQAIDWLKSPEGRVCIFKQYLFELEQIEDYQNCAIVRNKIVELEKEILEKSK